MGMASALLIEAKKSATRRSSITTKLSSRA